MNHKIALSILFLFIFNQADLCSQNDSIPGTVFEKGRFFTGLSGFINTTTTKFDSSAEERLNNYGLSFKSGFFLKERFLLGGLLQAERLQSGGDLPTSNETLLIAPFINYYLSNSPYGSIYASFSFGYVSYNYSSDVLLEEEIVKYETSGNGIGSIIGLGYAYSLNRSIVFELGINVTLYRVSLDSNNAQPSTALDFDSVNSNNLAFSFGFVVLLDEFFF